MREANLKVKGDIGANYVIEVRDNGPGIHPKQMMDALSSFGGSTLGFKNDHNMSEHGIGLKLNALRLGNTLLIISKTKPTNDYGSMTSYLTIGLLS